MVLTVTPLDFGFWVEDWWVPGPSRGVGDSHVGGMVYWGLLGSLFVCSLFRGMGRVVTQGQTIECTVLEIYIHAFDRVPSFHLTGFFSFYLT
jgi:hypothetical protein